MNKGKMRFLATVSTLTVLSISGCTTTSERELLKPAQIEVSDVHGGGVVIAQTELTEGEAAAASGQYLADCHGSNIGVTVESAEGDAHFVYGTNGEPCDKAETIFDGSSKKDTRMPPPAVHIAFKDQLGSQPATAETMPRVEFGIDEPITAEEFAVAATGTRPERKEKQSGLDIQETVNRWQAIRQNEKLFADLRDVERMSSGELIKVQQDKILELQAKLNEAKAQQKMSKFEGARIQADIERLRQQTEARGIAWDHEENKMHGEMREMKRRLSEYERRNQELAKSQEAKDKAHRLRISKLESDLRVAEYEADEVRKDMVLSAAKKIAEAERLAFAVRMAEKDAMQREAARKKQESDMLLERALRMKQGKTIVVPGLSDKLGQPRELNPLPIELDEVPVNVHADGQTLQSLMDKLLHEIKPIIGNWRISWQLSAENKFLLDETWTLTAEADMGEVLAFITQRIQETHNITLRFEQFQKVRLLVVSDGSSAPGISPEIPVILR